MYSDVDADIFAEYTQLTNPFNGIDDDSAKRKICALWGLDYKELDLIIESEIDRRAGEM